jgi:hypothetical protein
MELEEVSTEGSSLVVEHPERLSKRLLEQEARKAFYSPSVGEGKRKTKSLRVLSVPEAQERQH